MKQVRITISTIFQNGGDATRALEIAKIIRQYQPDGYQAKITFISHGSRFEAEALRLGFEIYRADPPMEGINFQDDFKTRFGDLISDVDLAGEILRGEIDAYKVLKPDLLIYGFWPIASIARRMTIPQTKTIAFLPIPLTEPLVDFVNSFPDELPLARLPRVIQRFIFRVLPRAAKLKSPALKHKSIRKAALNSGWTGLGGAGPLNHVFDMLRSDLYMINDFPVFYDTSAFGDRFVFTGPVYAKLGAQVITDARINEILRPENTRPKLFCSLGSSGDKSALLEIIKTFNHGAGRDWSGIILSPPSICDLETARAALDNENVYITDQFVPAKEINKLVDLVICHGGQGTLQTAITSGVPLVGVAAQPEQKLNLDHLQDFGMAIRIPVWKWKTARIRAAAQRVLGDKTYPQKARELMRMSESLQTDEIIGKRVWHEVLNA